MAQRVGTGIALLFHDGGTRRGRVVSSTPWPHFTPGKDPVPIVQEAGWAPGPVWMGRISCTHRDLIPDRPARSQSLYRLSYPAHTLFQETLIIYLFYMHSIIIYGIFLDNLPSSIKIFRIQKNIIRIITNSRSRDSFRDLFKRWEYYLYVHITHYTVIIHSELQTSIHGGYGDS